MAIFWGASWPAGKLVASAMAPLLAAAMRFSIAVSLLLLWLYVKNQGFPRLTRNQTLIVLLGGIVGVFGYGVFFMYGLQHVPASRASLVVTVNPVFTALLAAWLFKEKLNWKIGIGMVLATLGASIVLTRGEPWKILVGDIGHGEMLLFGCVACWVAYSLIGKRSMQGIEPLTATAYTSAAGLVCLWIGTIAIDGPPSAATLGNISQATWVAMAFLAIGATVLSYAWYFEGIATFGAGAAASYISLVPVFGVLSAAWWLGETIDSSILIGGLLAVSGVLWMNRARQL
jgi:drug/metabolite transporter (DMT)-like permease